MSLQLRGIVALKSTVRNAIYLPLHRSAYSLNSKCNTSGINLCASRYPEVSGLYNATIVCSFFSLFSQGQSSLQFRKISTFPLQLMSDNKNYAAAGLVETAKNEEKPNQHVDQLITLALDESYGPSALSYWMDETKNARFVLNEQFIRRALKDKPQVAHLLVVSWTDSVSKFSAGQMEAILGKKFANFEEAVDKPDELRSTLRDRTLTNEVVTFLIAADNFVSNLKTNIPIVQADIEHVIRSLRVEPSKLVPSIKLFERPELSKEILRLLKNLKKKRSVAVMQRDDVPICRVAALAGAGKTTYFTHLQSHLELAAGEDHSLRELVNHLCIIRMELNGGGDGIPDSHKVFEMVRPCIRARLLARGILGKEHKLVSSDKIFQDFMNTTNWKESDFVSRAIAEHRRAFDIPDDKVVIAVIIIDEYQNIAFNDRQTYPLKEALRDIAEANINPNSSASKCHPYGVNNYAISFITGINRMLIPIQNPNTETPLKELNLPVLTLAESWELFRMSTNQETSTYAEQNENFWLHESWTNSAFLERCLQGLGRTPRYIEALRSIICMNEELAKRLSCPMPINSDEYHDLIFQIYKTIPSFKFELVKQNDDLQFLKSGDASRLLFHIMTRTPLSLTEKFAKIKDKAVFERDETEYVTTQDIVKGGSSTLSVIPGVNSSVLLVTPLLVLEKYKSTLSRHVPKWILQSFCFPPPLESKKQISETHPNDLVIWNRAIRKFGKAFERLVYGTILARLQLTTSATTLSALLGGVSFDRCDETFYFAGEKYCWKEKDTSIGFDSNRICPAELNAQSLSIVSDAREVIEKLAFLPKENKEFEYFPSMLFSANSNPCVDFRLVISKNQRQNAAKNLMILFQTKENLGSTNPANLLREAAVDSLTAFRQSEYNNYYDFIFVALTTYKQPQTSNLTPKEFYSRFKLHVQTGVGISNVHDMQIALNCLQNDPFAKDIIVICGDDIYKTVPLYE